MNCSPKINLEEWAKKDDRLVQQPSIFTSACAKNCLKVNKVVQNEDKSVSVIITTYNGEDTVERAINSVLLQSSKNFEIIVVDDGSTDSTSKILKKYSNKIRILTQKRSGVTVARNHGLKMAKNDYVAFLDHDDTWIPTKLQNQVEILKKYPSVGLTFGNLEAVDKQGTSLGFTVMSMAKKCSSPSWQDILLMRMPIPPSTILVRKRLVNQIGGFDTNFTLEPGCEDRDFSLRMREITDFYYLDICLGSYYWRGQDWRYLPNLPYITKKYWKHRYLKNPENSLLRHNFITISTITLVNRMKQRLNCEGNQASYQMLKELNDYHIQFKEIFGNLYTEITGFNPIEAVHEDYADICLSTLLFVYLCRPDLQKSFPEVASGDLNGLMTWGLELAKGKFLDDYKEVIVQNKECLEKYRSALRTVKSARCQD